MILAIIDGPLTGIALETVITLKNGMNMIESFKTAIGMSMVTMNSMDWWLTGGAMLTWWVIPIMLALGFVAPWSCHHWRLKKWGKACHRIGTRSC